MYPMTIPTQGVDFTSVQGPGDDRLPSNEVSGYSLVSRVGEVVIQAFVDTAEFATVPEDMYTDHVDGVAAPGAPGGGTKVETKPMYHDWATVTPGMLTVARKDRTDTWRRNLSAEAATPRKRLRPTRSPTSWCASRRPPSPSTPCWRCARTSSASATDSPAYQRR